MTYYLKWSIIFFILEGFIHRVLIRDLLRVYSGTTSINYQTNAYRSESGKVYYDKRRTGTHRHKETYFARSPQDALSWVLYLADRTNDLPVIMVGDVPVVYKGQGCLPEGLLFPVTRLWIPRTDLDPDELHRRIWGTGTRIAITTAFVKRDPRSYLAA